MSKMVKPSKVQVTMPFEGNNKHRNIKPGIDTEIKLYKLEYINT